MISSATADVWWSRMSSQMVRNDLQLAAKLFRGFADPTRLAILEAVADDGELRVTDLVERVGGCLLYTSPSPRD